MQKFLLGTCLIFASLFLSGCSNNDNNPGHLLTVVTSPTDETRAMALILTRHYLGTGGSAQVLLCDSAAEMALLDSEAGDTVVQPADASARQMLGGLIEAGVQVDVCAIFLPNRDSTRDDLRAGVGVASPADIAKVMAAADTRLATF